MKVFYFGCWNRAGHFLHLPNGQWASSEDEHAIPWKSYDGCLCPGYVGPYERRTEVEGEAALHYKDGWTALAFWDRSVDKRGACNSVFFAEGTHGPAAMIEVASTTFPQVWKRFTFEVRVVQRPTADVKNPSVACSVCGRGGHTTFLDDWSHDPPGWFRQGEKLACSVTCVTRASGA